MIRRGLWLTAGAVAGIYGYRRVSAIGRRLHASLNPARPGVSLTQEARPVQGIRPAQGTRPVQGIRPAQGIRPVQGTRLVGGTRLARRGAVGLARETFRFTHDVREGMELYIARHSAPAGSTLSTDRSTDHEPKDGY